jgi:NADPH:quinone reductase-like Zn-dependent oxidoreductase
MEQLVLEPFTEEERTRPNELMTEELYRGITIVTQANAFMTSRLFEMWAERVFIPAVQERREAFTYTGKVILLMDGLGAHRTEKFLQDCRERGIEVVFLVAHSSDQTQPLDLVTFALLKQRYSASRFSRLRTPQSNKLVRILAAWFAASIPHCNAEAFASAGLVPVQRGGVFYLEAHPEEARRLRGWPAAQSRPYHSHLTP